MDKKSTFTKNILLILPHSIGGRLTISSISDGFKQNNCNVIQFDELTQSRNELTEIVEQNNFDYIAGYDFSAIKLKKELNLQLKSINYFSDEIDKPTAGEGYKELRTELNKDDNYVFYWDKELCEAEKNIKNLFYMPHFVNTEIYKPNKLKPEVDVMFAGRLDTEYRLNFIIELLKSLPNIKFAWHAIEKHYQDALSRTSEEKLIKKVYQGFIDNETDMAKALNNAKIIINMHSQGKSSFNYRTFQTMACQKLMLTDYRSEAGMLFGVNEIIYYNDLNDIKSKISHYLYNEVDYNKIIKNARARIIKDFDSKKCVEKMLKLVTNET